jgi:hypothetical protein
MSKSRLKILLIRKIPICKKMADSTPSCGQNSKIPSDSYSPYPRIPEYKKSAELKNLLKNRFLRIRKIYVDLKSEKIFVFEFDNFGVNRLLSSSPTTFAMVLSV